MSIKNVSIIGLGALGIMFGEKILDNFSGNLRFIADKQRIEKYKKGVYSNDRKIDFEFISPQDKTPPADLLIFAVKSTGLEAAIKSSEFQVDENTIIISLINGITSEEIIIEKFGRQNILYSVAQGMDATKSQVMDSTTRIHYKNIGQIVFGSPNKSDNIKKLSAFFDESKIPYKVSDNIKKHLWSKFMLNVGLNQVITYYEGDYETVQKPGEPREMMLGAMREVIKISEKENINLTEEDINYWLKIVATLNPKGLPSMRQDALAKVPTEVSLFSGTVLSYGKKHNIETPINKTLYNKIITLNN